VNKHIRKLQLIAEAPSRKIIGLMSGTSLDGLDIALCEFRGSGTETSFEVLNFKSVAYSQDFKNELKAISFKEQVSLLQLSLLNARVGIYSAQLVLEALQDWNIDPAEVDLIASHGQTIYHAPRSLHQLKDQPNATLQIGDGDHIAVGTGIITISDFRQKHVAAGGEGAPLAAYGDFLLFADATENRILLNIGGISNFTFLPKGKAGKGVFSTDIGPGNTLMDQFVQLKYPGCHYDKDAALASTGKLNEDLLKALEDHPFLDLPFPKTTGPELFNLQYLQNAVDRAGNPSLSDVDVLATLAAFTANTIVKAIRKAAGELQVQVYLSGGGMQNPLLVKNIAEGLGFPVRNSAGLGINPDAKEAVLFALLANDCIAGSGTAYGMESGIPGISMGKISLPL
jgi:anhydro-N-acetylmuramic acid kinase